MKIFYRNTNTDIQQQQNNSRNTATEIHRNRHTEIHSNTEIQSSQKVVSSSEKVSYEKVHSGYRNFESFTKPSEIDLEGQKGPKKGTFAQVSNWREGGER